MIDAETPAADKPRRAGKPARSLLSEWMHDHGISSETLAARSGYSMAAVASWRRLRSRPGRGTLHLVAKALRITPDALSDLLRPIP